MISEETTLNNTFNESTLKYFPLISIKSENKSKKYVPVKGVYQRRHKQVAPLPSTRTNELYAKDQYANEKEQSLLVLLNNEMEGGQSILVNSGLICFRDIHPIHVARAQSFSYSSKIACVCMCVRAYVRACVHACARVCVCVRVFPSQAITRKLLKSSSSNLAR